MGARTRYVAAMDRQRREVLSASERVRDSSGASASGSEDVHEGLREHDLGTWLRTEAAAAFDELRADPSQTVTGDRMRVDLAARHAERAEGH